MKKIWQFFLIIFSGFLLTSIGYANRPYNAGRYPESQYEKEKIQDAEGKSRHKDKDNMTESHDFLLRDSLLNESFRQKAPDLLVKEKSLGVSAYSLIPSRTPETNKNISKINQKDSKATKPKSPEEKKQILTKKIEDLDAQIKIIKKKVDTLMDNYSNRLEHIEKQTADNLKAMDKEYEALNDQLKSIYEQKIATQKSLSSFVQKHKAILIVKENIADVIGQFEAHASKLGIGKNTKNDLQGVIDDKKDELQKLTQAENNNEKKINEITLHLEHFDKQKEVAQKSINTLIDKRDDLLTAQDDELMKTHQELEAQNMMWKELASKKDKAVASLQKLKQQQS